MPSINSYQPPSLCTVGGEGGTVVNLLGFISRVTFCLLPNPVTTSQLHTTLPLPQEFSNKCECDESGTDARLRAKFTDGPLVAAEQEQEHGLYPALDGSVG